MRRVAIAAAWLLPGVASAHAGGPGVGAWSFEAWVVWPLLIALGLYAAGWWRLRRRATSAPPWRRALLFGGGWLVMALSLLSPLHAAGARSFAAHMLEHELLMLASAPLLVLARPLPVMLWAWPQPIRRVLGRSVLAPGVGAMWSALTHPVVATVVQAVALWLWHAPALFGLALAGEGWHVVQHLCFIVTALLFWSSMLDEARLRHHPMSAVIGLFVTALVSGALGALMAFSASPWYAGYARLGMTPFGLSPVEDQQLAGLLMWIPGGVVHAAAALAIVARLLRGAPTMASVSMPNEAPATDPRIATPPPRHAAEQGQAMPHLRHLLTAAFIASMAMGGARATDLRICADPNNLPFSNRQREGFENKLAELIARDLGMTPRYVWWAQRRGNLRNTLNAGRCDVVPGVASGLEMLATTRPYYRSTYVFVTRRSHAAPTSFDDPRLAQWLIGVQMIGDDGANTPPAHALSRRGLTGNVRGFPVYGNYANPNPPAAIVDAVARGDIDVAVAWGPMAGYFARREAVPLRLTPVSPRLDQQQWPMTFSISMGVRKKDKALRQRLDDALEKHHAAIQQLLRRYGVPLVDPGPATGTASR